MGCRKKSGSIATHGRQAIRVGGLLKFSLGLCYNICAIIKAHGFQRKERMQDRKILCTTFQEGFCKTNAILTHYTRTGSRKPPIVLLHGLAADGMCWKQIAQALADNFDVIMPDARGHGKSSAPDDGYNYKNLKNDVIAFLTAMNLSDVVLVGHSMGGLTAALAAGRSSSVRALVLADPTFLSLQKQREVWESDVIDKHKKMLAMSLDELIKDRQKAHPNRSENKLSAMARLQTSINAFNILLPPNPDYRQILKKVHCPCLLLYGDRGILSDQQAKDMRKLNALITTEKIKNAGHGIYSDQPARFVNSILKFVADL